MNCGQTIVLGCIKHSRWLIITRPQPHKCITPLCFNKCFIQTPVNRASISVYWSIKVHIDIQGDVIRYCRYVYVKMWGSVMSSRRYTSYKCPRLAIEHWQHFNLGSMYILPPNRESAKYISTFYSKIPLNICLTFLPKSLSMGERLPGPINVKYPGQEIKKIKLLTNSEKFKRSNVSH